MKHSMNGWVLMFLLFFAVGTTVGRANVINPVSVTASDSSSWSPTSDLLTTTGFSTSGDVSAWTVVVDNIAGMWCTNNVTVNAQWLLFDLGSSFNLTRAYFWQGYQANYEGRGVKDFEIWKSDATGTLISRLTSATTLTLNEAGPYYPSGTITTTGTQLFDLTGANAVRYIKIKINSTWSGATTEYVELGKVRFDNATVAAPTFDNAGGNFGYSVSPLTVHISCATDNATIHYTINGSGDPTESDPTYNASTGAIITHSTQVAVLKAKAFKTGFVSSNVTTATYTFVPGVITPVSVTASTEYLPYGPATGLLTNAGFTTTGDVSTWTVVVDNIYGMWCSMGGTVNAEWLLFDLGGQFNLSKTYLWQGYQAGYEGRGIKNFEIWKSDATGTLISRLTVTGLSASSRIRSDKNIASSTSCVTSKTVLLDRLTMSRTSSYNFSLI